MTDHARIAAAFAHARDYDRHARVQRKVAEELADRIAALPLPSSPRVLEIGCGTGFLTQALHTRGLRGEWLVTDIAPAMVERCRTRMAGAPGMTFAELDGEYGTPECGPFDLICSSLALQWFDDAPAALERMRGWLTPGGHVMAATLGEGSFAEWRAAHAAEGLTAGTPPFPPASAFTGASVQRNAEQHSGAREFLHALKAIGAGTADPAHRPLSPRALRRVMARFDASGASVTYEVVTCHLTRVS